MTKVGSRVGAILGTEGKNVKLLGYGVYEGDFVPDQSCGGMGAILSEAGIINPRIKLDSDKFVYGCECWWGPEDLVKAKIISCQANGYNIINVEIDEERAR
jgi:hypothetical protein